MRGSPGQVTDPTAVEGSQSKGEIPEQERDHRAGGAPNSRRGIPEQERDPMEVRDPRAGEGSQSRLDNTERNMSSGALLSWRLRFSAALVSCLFRSSCKLPCPQLASAVFATLLAAMEILTSTAHFASLATLAAEFLSKQPDEHMNELHKAARREVSRCPREKRRHAPP